MKVLLPCSFHSRTCNHRVRFSWLWLPRVAHRSSFRIRDLGKMPLPSTIEEDGEAPLWSLQGIRESKCVVTVQERMKNDLEDKVS